MLNDSMESILKDAPCIYILFDYGLPSYYFCSMGLGKYIYKKTGKVHQSSHAKQ